MGDGSEHGCLLLTDRNRLSLCGGHSDGFQFSICCLSSAIPILLEIAVVRSWESFPFRQDCGDKVQVPRVFQNR